MYIRVPNSAVGSSEALGSSNRRSPTRAEGLIVRIKVRDLVGCEFIRDSE